MSTSPQTPGQSIGESWNERMRMIRLRRKKESFRFRDEFRIVPRWLKVLCVVLYLIAVAVAVTVMNVAPEVRPHEFRDNAAAASLAVVGIITAISTILSIFIFTLGYVNRDAKRRGMNPTLWTLLVVVLSPGSLFIGLIIYLLIREPLPYTCPRCSQLVGPRFNFCPNCKCDLHPSCPNCKREIAETDKFCPYCAQDLSGSLPIEKSVA